VFTKLCHGPHRIGMRGHECQFICRNYFNQFCYVAKDWERDAVKKARAVGCKVSN
jgi:hypothetical protein